MWKEVQGPSLQIGKAEVSCLLMRYRIRIGAILFPGGVSLPMSEDVTNIMLKQSQLMRVMPLSRNRTLYVHHDNVMQSSQIGLKFLILSHLRRHLAMPRAFVCGLSHDITFLVLGTFIHVSKANTNLSTEAKPYPEETYSSCTIHEYT